MDTEGVITERKKNRKRQVFAAVHTDSSFRPAAVVVVAPSSAAAAVRPVSTVR